MGIKRNECTFNPRAGIGMMGFSNSMISGPGGTIHTHQHQHVRHPQHAPLHNGLTINSMGLQVAPHMHHHLAPPRMSPTTSLTLTMVPSQSRLSSIKHEAPPPQPHMRNLNCIVPNHHYARPESFMPQGPAAVYGTGGASGTSTQGALRGTSTSSQPAASAQPQDMAKQTMGFVPQSQPTRPPMTNYAYRTPHPPAHAPRPSTHHRQQTIYGNTPGSGAMYNQMMNPGMITPMYSQPGQHLVGSTTYVQPQRPTFYAQNSSALQSIIQQQQQQHTRFYASQFQNQAAYHYAQSGALLERSQQAASAPSTPPQFGALGHPSLGGTLPQNITMQQKMPRLRPNALKIIHPDTGEAINVENSEESLTSGESSERHTPHLETSSIAEEFKERVKDSVNEDLHSASHMNAISKFTDSISNSDDNKKPETVAEKNDVMSVLTEIKPEPSETPVVSALSNSPEIVPKQSQSNLKQQIKTLEHPHSDSAEVTTDISKADTTSIVINKIESSPVELETHFDKPYINCETSPVTIDKQGSNNVSNGNTENISESIKIDKLFNDFNSKVPLSSTDFKQTSLTKKDSNEINANKILKKVTVESTLQTQVILTTENAIVTSEKIELLDAVDSEALSHQEEVTQTPLHSVIHIESPHPTGQLIKDDRLSNNNNLDADTSNRNIENITFKVDPVVINEENRSLSDKSSLVSLTPKFAQKLLENNNVSKDETDRAVSTDQDKLLRENNEENDATTEIEVGSVCKAALTAPPTLKFPKYHYSEGQWSPTNPTGAKCYDRDFLMQLQDDPKSRIKPDNIIIALLRTKAGSMESSHSFTTMQRPSTDTLFPMFAKNSSQRGGMMMRGEPKKTSLQGKPAMKSSSSSMGKQNVIHVSLSLREDVKLNESDNAWKPGRLISVNAGEDEKKTMELYKNVRAVLNKITPQKFQALLGQIKALNIDNQERLEGVIDLVFEKAIDEPNYSVAYASMCKELGLMQVPANTTGPEPQFVNFRSLIIKRCQERFQKTEEEENRILKERDQMEADDQVKLKFLEEESRKIRWKSVGNIRFIGELYKHNMLTTKIMNHCIQTLVTDPDEPKLECLCKLLTTIGKELEKATNLDHYFKLMKEMVDRKRYNSISSRVRFMLQDVIDLRARQWATKTNDVPRTMDEIQKEAEAEQRHIQIMNANPSSARKDERGSSKRGNAGGRSGSSNSMDNDSWYTQKGSRSGFSVDSSKLRNINSNVDNVKLGPTNMTWSRGSGAKTTSLRSTPNPIMPITSNNMYGLLENVSNETIPPIRSDLFSVPKDNSASYHLRGSSIERPASKSTTTPAMSAPSSSASARGSPSAPDRMPEDKIKLVIGASLDEYFAFNDLKEIALDVTQRFNSRDHAIMIQDIFNIAFEKPEKVHEKISNVLVHLVVNSKAVSKENFLVGLEKILESTPDQVIDIPMIYNYVATLVTPVILHQGLTLQQLWTASHSLVEDDYRGRLLCCVLNKIVSNWGRNFTRSKWAASGLSLKQWLAPDQVESFIKNNKFEFLEGGINPNDNADNIQLRLDYETTQKKLLLLMNTEQSEDSIDAWTREHVVKDNQFIRAFVQAMCEHALTPVDGHSVRLDIGRLSKYTSLLLKYCERYEWHLQCLLAVQQLIHKLEHPQGLSLDIFQHFYDNQIFSEQAFSEWEKTDLEPEGKAVMLKALVSFFTRLRECEDDDSGSED